MSKSKQQKKRDDDNFLPGPGQASDDKGEDFLVQCFAVILEAVWNMVVMVARPLWALVVFLCYEAWVDKKGGGK